MLFFKKKPLCSFSHGKGQMLLGKSTQQRRGKWGMNTVFRASPKRHSVKTKSRGPRGRIKVRRRPVAVHTDVQAMQSGRSLYVRGLPGPSHGSCYLDII